MLPHLHPGLSPLLHKAAISAHRLDQQYTLGLLTSVKNKGGPVRSLGKDPVSGCGRQAWDVSLAQGACGSEMWTVGRNSLRGPGPHLEDTSSLGKAWLRIPG